MKYEAVIGLEVHAQLSTKSKIFCVASAAFGGEPNSNVSPISLGMPGVLPVLNKKVVEYGMRMALATNCRINETSVFARKNYFYPDLPKGYQISQYEDPLCEHGFVDIEENGATKRIGLTRIHLEEDAGKSIHHEDFVDENETLVDLNRCGVPLIEIVSEPDIRSPHEAYLFLTHLRQLVQYLGICDGNMEEGSLRCDANISVRPLGEKTFGVKTELKNMNSIRGVEKALEFEINRQIEVLKDGGNITQQTLLWDADRNVARPMRGKEYAHDYRYFPDPDLVPVVIDRKWIDAVRKQMPELPAVRRERFVKQYNLPDYDAAVLTDSRELADYFEAVAQKCGDAKVASNWVMGEASRRLNDLKVSITNFPVSPDNLAALINLVDKGTVSGKIAKSVFEAMVSSQKTPEEIIKEKGLVQISDSGELENHVKNILDENPDMVEKYLGGKEQLIGFFVGQVMKATRGQANPKLVNEILRKKLKERA